MEYAYRNQDPAWRAAHPDHPETRLYERVSGSGADAIVEALSPKARVYADYEVDAWGIIRSPGKFEAESWIAPIVYSWYLEGDRGEEVMHRGWSEEAIEYHDYHESCDGCESTNVYVLDAETRAELEMSNEPEVYALTLDESEQGFVYIGMLSREEYDQAVS